MTGQIKPPGSVVYLYYMWETNKGESRWPSQRPLANLLLGTGCWARWTLGLIQRGSLISYPPQSYGSPQVSLWRNLSSLGTFPGTGWQTGHHLLRTQLVFSVGMLELSNHAKQDIGQNAQKATGCLPSPIFFFKCIWFVLSASLLSSALDYPMLPTLLNMPSFCIDES